MSFDFEKILKNKNVDFNCPKCNGKLSISLSQIGSFVVCRHCKSKIELQKGKNFDSAKSKIDKSVKDLENTFKNFGK